MILEKLEIYWEMHLHLPYYLLSFITISNRFYFFTSNILCLTLDKVSFDFS